MTCTRNIIDSADFKLINIFKKIFASFKMRKFPNNLVTLVKSESDRREMRMSIGTLEACRRISLLILPADEVSFTPDTVKNKKGEQIL